MKIQIKSLFRTIFSEKLEKIFLACSKCGKFDIPIYVTNYDFVQSIGGKWICRACNI